MNSNIQTSLPLEASLQVRELAAKSSVTVSQWVREVIMAKLEADSAENAERAEQLGKMLAEATRRYQ